MTAQTLTLTDFLLARIAEDEAVAAAADTVDRDYPSSISVIADDTDGGFLSIDIAPERVLAECEAKRRIVERGPSECGDYEDQDEYDVHHYPDPAWAFCDGCAAAASADADWLWTLRTLATVYADHPDFRPEWRP